MSRPRLTESQKRDAFRGLAHPIRREIVSKLTAGPVSVGDLRHTLQLTPENMTQHLNILREVGLIRSTPVGRQVICKLDRRVLRKAGAWVDTCLQAVG